jgi:predicted RNA polymerase sigma factor
MNIAALAVFPWPSRSHTPRVAISSIENVELRPRGRSADYQPFHAAPADLLQRAGCASEAIAAYGRALALAHDDAEQSFLGARREELAQF